MQVIKLSDALEFKLRSMKRGHSTDIKNSCNMPFTNISVDANSDCFLCGCDGWLPIPVGKVQEFDDCESVWNAPLSQVIQKNISDKKYTWCAVQHCGIINNNIENPTYQLSINIDDSCNLACPSCRRELKMIESGPEFDSKIKDVNKIMSWLEKFDKPVSISFGGSGDLFASPILRPLVLNFKPKSTQTFSIITNGLLLKKMLPQTPLRQSIHSLNISVDAGSAEVYEKVRRPGRWSVLMDNLQWLKENKSNTCVYLGFVVQRTNYRDLPAFVELCQQLGFRGYLQSLVDWGTWNSVTVETPDSYTQINGTFDDHNVADPGHPEHSEFLEILTTIRDKQYKFLELGIFK